MWFVSEWVSEFDYPPISGILFIVLVITVFYTNIRTRIRKPSDLSNEVVVITGGASGIGRLLAIDLLTKHHCRVVIWDVNVEALQTLQTELEASMLTDRFRCDAVDVTNRHQVYETARLVLQQFQRVDILINNAGIVQGKPFLQTTDELIERTLQINTLSHFWTLRAFLPKMMERNHGHVVSVSSMAGLVGIANMMDYSASKHAVVGLSESLRTEMKRLNLEVHSTCVCPFFVRTGMFAGATAPHWCFGWMVPLLEPQYVVDRMIEAIQYQETFLVLPAFCHYVVPLLYGVLPRWIIDGIFEVVGALRRSNITVP